jgi:hypothetical protein
MNDHSNDEGLQGPIRAQNIAETVASIMQRLPGAEPRIVEINHHIPPSGARESIKPLIADVPEGRKIQDMTDLIWRELTRLKPARRTGVAHLTDLRSFVEWTIRNMGDSTVVFADRDRANPSVTAIANYHESGPHPADGFDSAAMACDHRAKYSFPLSDEWKAWMRISGQPLDKDELGLFLEDHILDVIEPPVDLLVTDNDAESAWMKRLRDVAYRLGARWGGPARLLELTRFFSVHEDTKFTMRTDRDTGESSLIADTEQHDGAGGRLNIPNLYLLGIRVFDRGPHWQVPLRFRYRKAGAVVKFFVTLHDPAAIIDAALDEAYSEIAETNVPVIFGRPEA